MWTLVPEPPGDLDAELTRALTFASGVPVYALSPIERDAVHAVYQLYEDLAGQPGDGLTPASLNGARLPLHDAYGQVQIGGRLAALRERLLASADYCPYCGFGEPRDLDHYLPRSRFGELAIYPRNLIPSCNPCNTAKRTMVPGQANGEAPGFIHPYYQVLPDRDFLKADVRFEAGALEVAFTIDPSDIEAHLAARLSFQLDRLKLNERYPKRINGYLSEQRVAILQIWNAGDEALLRQFLETSANSLAVRRGRNDWRVALLRALALDPDFPADPERYLGPIDRTEM